LRKTGPFTKKRLQKPENGIKVDFEEMEQGLSSGNSPGATEHQKR